MLDSENHGCAALVQQYGCYARQSCSRSRGVVTTKGIETVGQRYGTNGWSHATRPFCIHCHFFSFECTLAFAHTLQLLSGLTSSWRILAMFRQSSMPECSRPLNGSAPRAASTVGMLGVPKARVLGAGTIRSLDESEESACPAVVASSRTGWPRAR